MQFPEHLSAFLSLQVPCEYDGNITSKGNKGVARSFYFTLPAVLQSYWG